MKSLIVTITAACALFSASYALADGPPAKTPPPKAAAAQHEMCSGMMGGKMPAGKGQMGGMKGPDGKPMSKAEMDKMHKMCGEMPIRSTFHGQRWIFARRSCGPCADLLSSLFWTDIWKGWNG